MHVCVFIYIYIHNKYTQYTHIYYVILYYVTKTFILDAINRLTTIFIDEHLACSNCTERTLKNHVFTVCMRFNFSESYVEICAVFCWKMLISKGPQNMNKIIFVYFLPSLSACLCLMDRSQDSVYRGSCSSGQKNPPPSPASRTPAQKEEQGERLGCRRRTRISFIQ